MSVKVWRFTEVDLERKWLTYSDLWRLHNLTRGALDCAVHSGLVPHVVGVELNRLAGENRFEPDQQYYDATSILMGDVLYRLGVPSIERASWRGRRVKTFGSEPD